MLLRGSGGCQHVADNVLERCKDLVNIDAVPGIELGQDLLVCTEEF